MNRRKRAPQPIVAAVAGLAVVVAAVVGSGPAPAQTGGPPKELDEPATGHAAVVALGDDLPAVAARHRMTAARLRAEFEHDDTLWVDETGRLFYIEPSRTGTPSGPSEDEPFPSATPADVFALHSRPGAARVIHLDFDGHVATGTAWNDNAQIGTGSVVTSAAYDADGDPNSFSAAEADVIYDTWLRVAEDYAPFAVDVTTADPGFDAIDRSSDLDTTYGTRVVITGGNDVGTWCGCGGVAYVGAVDVTPDHDYYQPAFVFQAGLGGVDAPAKNLAEAAAHEAGHTLGLFHDGSSTSDYYFGHGAWAPIMGLGYYRPITHWSAGEYSGANNTEDDLARMTTFGAPALADDHGDTIGAATPLGSSASGVIGSGTDVDAFTFTLSEAASTTVTATPASVGPNLDIHLSLLDDAGTVLAVDDPPSSQVTGDVAGGLDATVAVTLGAGTYHVIVDGTGAGDVLASGYSDYGSLGAYTLAVTHDTGTCVAPPSGIVGWWTGEDSTAAEVGPTLAGSPAYGPGIVGRALVLDGAGLPADGFPVLAGDITVEAWIQPERTGFTQALFSRFRPLGADDDDAYALFLTDDQLLWVVEEPTLREPPRVSVHAPELFDGAFHHVAATWGDQLVLYVDGVAVATSPAYGQINPAPDTALIVGATSTGPGHDLGYSGVLDEPTIYDRALSANEIQSIANAGAGGKCSA